MLVLLGYFYSVKPFRIKTRPPFDSISNALLYVVFPFLVGQSYFNSSISLPREIIFVASLIAGLHAVASLRDYTFDKKVGDSTFATKFGKSAATVLFPLTIIATLLFGNIDSKIIRSSLYLTLGLSIWVMMRREERIVVFAGKILPYIFYPTIITFFTLKLL